MRSTFAGLLLLATFAGVLHTTDARAQQFVVCNTTTDADCITASNPGNGNQGDPAWLSFGKINANFTFVSPLWSLGANQLVGSQGADTLGPITVGSGLSLVGGVLTATGGGGGSVSLTAASSNIVLSPSPITGTGTIGLAAAPTIAGTNVSGTAGSLSIGGNAATATSATTAATATNVAVGGVTGLGTGVGTFLATPSAANLGAAVTGASLVQGTNVTITGTWPNQTVNSSSASTGANPTATVSGTATNGVATTFMRSDAAPALATTAVTPGSYTYSSLTVDANGRLTSAASGAAPAAAANPTGTAGPTAVNGTATTFMRSDGAPAVQKASAAQFGIVETDGSTITPSAGVISCTTATTGQLGCVKPDGTTITVASGVISAVGGAATTITPGTTTITGATAPCLIDNSTSTTMGCAALGSTLALSSGTLNTTAPNRTVTSSPTVLSTDMGGQINSNVSGGGTLTIPAISSTVFAAGATLTVVNYSASTEAVSTTPTVNAGGGCVTATGIPAGDTWQLISNGTTIDCSQTVSSSSGGGVSSFSGDSALLSNSGSTGAVTATLANTGVGYGVWGNTGSSSGAPGYHAMSSYSTAAFPTLNQNTTGSAASLTVLSGLPSQAADTIVMNATGSSASPTAVGIGTLRAAILQAVTTFTVAGTGCTPSAHAGGAFAGTVTLASGPCTSLTITMNGATGFTTTTGYTCSVGDKTTQNAGTWIPKWGESASSTTTATLPVPSAAGATDVLSFDCTPY